MRKQTFNFGILVALWLIFAFGSQGIISVGTQDPLQVTVVTSSDFDRNLADAMVQNFEYPPQLVYLNINGSRGQSDPLTSEDLVGSSALWFVLTKGVSSQQLGEFIPVSTLVQYVASGGHVLIWAPTVTKLPLEFQEFLGVANIIDEFSQTGDPGPSGYPIVSLRVTNPALIMEPFTFSANETLTYEGYGSIIGFQSFMEEVVRIEKINSRGKEQTVDAAAIAYSQEATGGTKWVITTTPLNPRIELRFLQLITNVCQTTITGAGSIPSTTSTSPDATTVETSTSHSESSASQDLPNFPFDLTSVKAQTAIAVAAISSLAILGAAVKAASLPPLILGKRSIKDFLKRLLWYLFYPFIWIFGHVVYDPVIRRLKEEDVTTNTTRQAILQLLEERGVAYLREIERAVGSGIFGLMWHLQVLEDFGHIRHTRIGNYLVYYLRGYGSLDQLSPELSFLFKNENARDIINYILNHPGTYQAEIARALGLHHDSVRYHLLSIRENELVESFSDGRITRYFIIDEKRNLIQSILQNNRSKLT